MSVVKSEVEFKFPKISLSNLRNPWPILTIIVKWLTQPPQPFLPDKSVVQDMHNINLQYLLLYKYFRTYTKCNYFVLDINL